MYALITIRIYEINNNFMYYFHARKSLSNSLEKIRYYNLILLLDILSLLTCIYYITFVRIDVFSDVLVPNIYIAREYIFYFTQNRLASQRRAVHSMEIYAWDPPPLSPRRGRENSVDACGRQVSQTPSGPFTSIRLPPFRPQVDNGIREIVACWTHRNRQYASVCMRVISETFKIDLKLINLTEQALGPLLKYKRSRLTMGLGVYFARTL